jgi:hypothetical protein
VPWQRIALVTSLLAIAALAALILVASLKQADALSTVALSLAILAFVAQIVVFLGQAWTSSRQMLQSETLNAQTLSILSEVRTSAAGTQAMLLEQFDTVLKHALANAPGIKSAVADQDALRQQILQSVRGELAVPGGPRPLSEAQQERLAMLKSWPPEDEGRPVVSTVRHLSPAAIAELIRFAQDEQSVASSGGHRGFYLESDNAGQKELRERELLEETDVPQPFVNLSEGTKWVRLTPPGITAARLFTAEGPPPQYWSTEN